MKRKCTQDLYQWHRWFAWYPVSTTPTLDGSRYCWTTFWWVYVERRMASSWAESSWYYRPVKKEEVTA